MAIPRGACPICWVCVKKVREGVHENSLFVLSDTESEWSELEELILASNPTRDVQIVRAVCVLEWVCSYAIPSMLSIAGRSDVLEGIVLNPSVSKEGMEEFSSYLSSTLRKLRSYIVSVTLKQEQGHQQQAQLMRRVETLVVNAAGYADYLRCVFKADSTEPVHPLGKLLCLAFTVMSTPTNDIQLLIRNLLDVTLENPKWKWRPTCQG